MASARDIEEQAAKWLIELDADSTPERWARHEQWMACSPLHRAAFLRLSCAWSRASALRKLRPLDQRVDPDLLAKPSRELDNEAEGRTERPPARLRRFAWRRVGLAAAVSTAAVVCVAIAWQTTREFSGAVHETGFGNTELVALADGSTIRLNSDSQVRIRYTKSLRSIELERGEALFEVAPDVRRPFRVSAGTTRTTAADSRFAVRRKSADIVEVQVAKGLVVFERVRASSPFAKVGARFTRTLWAGYTAAANPRGVTVRNVGTAAVQRHMAWVTGQVSFLGETLAEAVLEINRYSPRRLVIADPRIANLRVSGTFNLTDHSSFVASLEHPLKVRALRTPARERGSPIRLVSMQP